MNIIVLANSDHVGGAERIAHECYREIACTTGGAKAKIRYLHSTSNRRGVYPKLKRTFESFLSVVILFISVAGRDKQIIISHMHQSNIVARLLALVLPNIKVYNYIHSNTELKSALLRYILTDRYVFRYVFVSESSYNIQKHLVDTSKCIIIPNRVDTARFYFDPDKSIDDLIPVNTTDSSLIFLVAGRLEPEKNISSLLSFWSKFDITDRLIICGDGSLKQDLLNQVSGSNADIQFMSTVQNIENYYNTCDILISNSVNESFGLVILEALNCGCTVFSAAGPHTEYFRFYQNFHTYRNDDELIKLINTARLTKSQLLAERKKFTNPAPDDRFDLVKNLKL